MNRRTDSISGGVNLEKEINSVVPEEGGPLVTFALFAYNQEQFIREAVQGAFDQIYSPLEIILSDDFSEDKTFDIMSDMVRDYNGLHKIIINRNRQNIGLIEHVNTVLNMCSGELVVLAAGDDISLPIRVLTLVRNWGEEPNISAISSGFININIDGNVSENAVRTKTLTEAKVVEGSKEVLKKHIMEEKYSIAGCTEAIVFKKYLPFKQIPAETISEDRVFTFRSLLLDGIMFVPDKLVMYRAHENNVFNNRNNLNEILTSAVKKEKRTQFVKENKYGVLGVYLVDLTNARDADIIDKSTHKYLEKLLKRKSYSLGKQSVWWTLRIDQKLVVLLNMTYFRFFDDLKWATVRIIPYEMFVWLKQIKINKKKIT